MLNQMVMKILPMVPKGVVHLAAKRYVAGDSLLDAIKTVKQLNRQEILGTIDCLGEFVSERKQAEEALSHSHAILDAIHANQLKSGLSVKLTSLGLEIDNEFCYQQLKSLVSKARNYERFVRIDMENTPYTDRTLQLYRRLNGEGFDNTGVVIQAYLKRSETDILSLAPLKTSVRLCKGIYNEDPSLAYKDRQEIQNNFKRLLALLFEKNMYPAIATHDEELIDFARNYISTHSIRSDQYEFQMLLGVRETCRNELVKEGHRVRIYVPFGKDWYGYSMRRLKENPQMAGHILRAFFLGD